MDKAKQYLELVGRRKICDGCPCLHNASRMDGGCLDSDEIGPYSRWQGNLYADLMVVAGGLSVALVAGLALGRRV
jgi:hypothetical protein